MIYLKSALAGLAALIVTTALIIGVTFIAPLIMELSTLPASSDASWSFNGPWVSLRLILALMLLVFTAVFLVTLRKLSRANQRQH